MADDTFRQVFEAAPNAMIVVAAGGRIALVNAQAEKIFGYQRDELIGMPIETLIPERFRAILSSARWGLDASCSGAGKTRVRLRWRSVSTRSVPWMGRSSWRP